MTTAAGTQAPSSSSFHQILVIGDSAIGGAFRPIRRPAPRFLSAFGQRLRTACTRKTLHAFARAEITATLIGRDGSALGLTSGHRQEWPLCRSANIGSAPSPAL